MNKSALKKFAIEARRELLEKVELQARKLGITAESIQKVSIESSDAVFIEGRQLSDTERKQRNKLISRINNIGFDHVMNETAYTWFNRFVALRYMEVNDYLPTKVRVLSSNSGGVEPDMMKEALSLNLNLDKDYVYDLKLNNKTDELFKYLIKMHCNDLNRYMPFMFETIEDYSEILFPDGLLGTDSFLKKMTNTEIISENNWYKVEIIGWLYQYYISEEKEEVFTNLKKNIKITKEKLPAATQLFTPNWIVRYMVENSLGRIWTESYPKSSLKNEWMYYLKEASQEENTNKQLKEIKYKNVNPEEIKFLDPCCGSGHVLVYAFDIFYELYLEKGYIESEIPILILEKNLYGIDIDDRAAQMASFAVMMKAREKSRRIFRDSIKPNIYSIQESNWLTDNMIKKITKNNIEIQNILFSLKNNFKDAKEYGSLLKVELSQYGLLEEFLEKYKSEEVDLFELVDKQVLEEKLPLLLKQSNLLNEKYDVVCTNPPYMGRGGMNPNLIGYLNTYYPDTKSDLFAAFIERGFELLKDSGFNSMVTMQSWMFLSSYEKMRKKILDQKTISTLLHMDNMVMGIAFGTAATVFRNVHVNQYLGTFTEVTYKDISSKETPIKFPIFENRSGKISAKNLKKIPGNPIAYWVSEKMIKNFNGLSIGSYLTTREGMATADNNKFLKNWFEVINNSINFTCQSTKDALDKKIKWVPYNKGGSYRKWYGNNEYIVNWENDGFEIKNNIDKTTGRIRSHNYNGEFSFKKGITWSALSSGNISVRLSNEGFLFDSKGAKGFCDDEKKLKYIMALINSKVGMSYLKFISPTIDFKVGDVIQIPLLISEEEKVNQKVDENILISKHNWDAYETSWDFKRHPLLMHEKNQISFESSWNKLKIYEENQLNNFKKNEELLNQIFIEMYGLQGELSQEVCDEDISIQKSELKENVKSFLSYFVACYFGRYSLDKEGLIYAGGEFDVSQYKTFSIDEDNIIPILSGAYFEDDIITKIVDFVRITFSEETLEENLDFIAAAIGRKKNETAREALRRYFLNDFYKDHVKTYKKRPIYWLFTSGKEKAFSCLIYMHRYDKTTLSRIRTDYLHEVQIRLDAEKKDLLDVIEGDSTSKEINNAKKELKSLDKKIDELKAYDELLHHMADMQIEIDLDDGVKVNYEKFKGLVAKI
ncbi:BREX-1 system adenine-specific DNA-methyltransferase PglX [Exiguobacterium sp. TBG-PICH-001]|nr:BREX-1 system adenine-specific DNA-methyltransferase PglX [Exiguobacterium sp. TBG-PICH-001]MBF8154004.1 BREX-1 system adenine-specific DNA-methyltransferase PglX [Exiguobacterium sp. TBG-PICH-001]